HGGAWATNCSVNWHKRQLKLIAVQFIKDTRKFTGAYNEGADKFFKTRIDKSTDEYSGRMK
ncbi:MAG: hypothetical protein IKP58_10000, partial [Victivallales bacterium]|nr:hypothetical protein [Victivallales bacterium]